MRCDYCKTWHEWTIWETKLLPEGWEFQTGLSGVRVLCMKCHDSYKEEARSMRAHFEEHRPLPAGEGHAVLERARILVRGAMNVERKAKEALIDAKYLIDRYGIVACTEALQHVEGQMNVECGMCGRPKPEQAMVAAEDGLLICAKCHREYKDLEDELDQAFEDLFEDAT